MTWTWLLPVLAQTSFSDVNETDWTATIVLWVVLFAGLIAVVLWRTKAFEGAVDAACAGKPVSVRAAYNQFWLIVAGALVVVAAVGGVAMFTDVKRFFIAG